MSYTIKLYSLRKVSSVFFSELYLPGPKGAKGDTGASIVSADFIDNDIVFTKDDSTEVILEDAKTNLKGDTGVGLQFDWQDTELGIKREDEIDFDYTDLKGDQGIQGEQGEQGPKGNKGDTGEGVIPGGLEGQVLAKKTNSDYDTEWIERFNETEVNTLYQPNGENGFVFTDNSGNLHIEGNIIQSGESYETHSEQLYTTKDFIITRDGAISGLGLDEISGIKVLKYDGLNDLVFGTDNDGFFKVGEAGDLQTLCTREDNPISFGVPFWNANYYRFDTDEQFIWTDRKLGLRTTTPRFTLDVLGTAYVNSLLTSISAGGFIEIGGERFAGAVSIPVGSTTTLGGIESPWFQTGIHQNYLRYTEQFDRSGTSDWVRSDIQTVTANTHNAPLETALTADTIIGANSNAKLTQSVVSSATGIDAVGDWVFSIYLLVDSGTANIGLQINSLNNNDIVEEGTIKTVEVNDSWQRFSVVQKFTNALHNRKQVVLHIGDNTVVAWGCQLEPNNYARRYSGARTTTLLTAETSTARIPTALAVASSFSATSGSFTSSVSSTRSGTPTAPVEGLRSVAGASKSAIPVRPSPQILLASTSWNTAGSGITNTQSWALEAMGISGDPTDSIFRLLYGGHGVAIADRTEIFNIDSNGNLSLTGAVGNFSTGINTSNARLHNNGMFITGGFDNGNYTISDTDGFLNLMGKAAPLKNIFIPTSSAIFINDLNIGTLVNGHSVYYMPWRENAAIEFHIALPNDIKEGDEKIRLSVHYVGLDDDRGKVTFVIDYYFVSDHFEIPRPQQTHLTPDIDRFPQRHMIMEANDYLVPEDHSIKSKNLLAIKLTRVDDDYRGAVGIFGINLEYVSDRLGNKEELLSMVVK